MLRALNCSNFNIIFENIFHINHIIQRYNYVGMFKRSVRTFDQCRHLISKKIRGTKAAHFIELDILISTQENDFGCINAHIFRILTYFFYSSLKLGIVTLIVAT